MDNKSFVLLVCCLSVFFVRCQKEADQVPKPEGIKAKDTVELMHVVITPSTKSIEVLPEHNIVVEQKVELQACCGDDEYRYNIVSKHKNMAVSYGILPSGGNNTFLQYGDNINNSIDWVSEYTNAGTFSGSEIGFRSEYTGIKIEENGKTMFGWLHTPYLIKITEFAIDTTGSLSSISVGAIQGVK